MLLDCLRPGNFIVVVVLAHKLLSSKRIIGIRECPPLSIVAVSHVVYLVVRSVDLAMYAGIAACPPALVLKYRAYV